MNHQPSIIAHCLVKNEARFLWYSISSIIKHVDKILLWDTGSTDGSREIEKEIEKKWPGKIVLKERPQKTADEFTQVRQEMLEATTSDWFIVADADEIWWEDSIKKVLETIQKEGDKLESIVVPTVNLVGDVFHYQPESAGKYKIAGRVGHYNLRAINRNIPGLQALGPHGQMGWADGKGVMIQDRNKERVKLIDAPYLHATNLRRAGGGHDVEVIKRKKKLKYELGIVFPKDFYYPEAFFKSRPEFVESPWEVMGTGFKLRAALETPLRKLKRKFFESRVGY